MDARDRDWLAIISRASTVSERLACNFVPSVTTEAQLRAQERLEKWCRISAGGDWNRFTCRLSLDGLTAESAGRVLAPGCLPPRVDVPPWAVTLQETSRIAGSMSFEAATELVALLEHDSPPIPFQDVLAPFLRLARARLKDCSGASYALLREDAHAGLELRLLKRLSNLAARALLLEFDVYRACHQAPWARWLKQTPQRSTQLYREFVEGMLQGGFVGFFREYSVLGRLMAVATNLWVDGMGEFMHRLASDWRDIGATFLEGVDPGHVVAAQSHMSDCHHGGRAVMQLTFASGLKLIYKPKDLSVDESFQQLLKWCNRQNLSHDLKVLRVLNRRTYGWVEHVEHLPCEHLDQARRYFTRAGMLLGLIYALQGTDCHHENLIACGAHPVLVDAEMLMCPVLKTVANPESASEKLNVLAYRELYGTVLGTLFLPIWHFGAGGVCFDIGGVGGEACDSTLPLVPSWCDVNSDDMRLEAGGGAISAQKNDVMLHDVRLSACDYAAEIASGFTEIYRHIVAAQKGLPASDLPLEALADARVRFTFRDTRQYTSLLTRARDPRLLRDAADLCIYSDLLIRPVLPSPGTDLWMLVREELQDLWRLDIPRFATQADSRDLALSSGVTLQGFFEQSAFDHALSHLRKMNEEDLTRQVYLIRGALRAYSSIPAHAAEALPAPYAISEGCEKLSQQELVGQALAIAEGLRDRAIRSKERGATWISFVFFTDSQRSRIQPVDYGLYSGSCGIALFLAAIERVIPGAGFGEFALQALELLRSDLRSQSLHWNIETTGWGSPVASGASIYALARTSQFLGDEGLLEDACRLAQCLTPDSINEDCRLDVLSGSAGAIFGLLTLHQLTGKADLVDKSVACGRHLVDRQEMTAFGRKAWKTVRGSVLTGFAHGAAGISSALVRLFKVTADESFREAALEGYAFERELFAASKKREADGLPPIEEKRGFTYSWCHGAAGIGLSGLEALDLTDSAQVRQEMESAIHTTLQPRLQGIDGLCCGNMGRVDLLFTAGRHLGRQDLAAGALEIASQVVARGKGQNGFCLIGDDMPSALGCFPGFFQGEAGIGYQLLRLVDPGNLPSVLLFE